MTNAVINRVRLPKWFLEGAILLLVFLLGLVDYLTGDYSLLIYYMIPVALGSWFIGAGFGIIVAIFGGIVRLCADYATYTDFSFSNYLNVAQDAVFLLIIAGITIGLRSKL